MFGMPCRGQPHRHHHADAARPGWQHLAYLQEKGVKFDRRVEHGMTHSLYIHIARLERTWRSAVH